MLFKVKIMGGGLLERSRRLRRMAKFYMQMVQQLPTFSAIPWLVQAIEQFIDRRGCSASLVEQLNVTLLDRPMRWPGPRGKSHSDQINFSVLFIFQKGQIFIGLRIHQRHLGRTSNELTRELEVVLFQRDCC